MKSQATPSGKKLCAKCNARKPLAEFSKVLPSKASPHRQRYRARCKECMRADGKRKSAKTREIKAIQPIPDKKVCIACLMLKPICHYSEWRSGLFGMRAKCKECVAQIAALKKSAYDVKRNEKAKEYRKANILEFREYGRKRMAIYLNLNRDCINNMRRDRYSRNIDRYRGYSKNARVKMLATPFAHAKHKENIRLYKRKAVRELSDRYIADCLGGNKSALTETLIETKRIHLKIKRELKNGNH